MMNLEDPPFRRYLDQLRIALEATSISVKERREILLEIESHIAEARKSGAPLADILEKLGPAEELARAYAVELLLHSPGGRSPAVRGILQILAVLTTLTLAIVLGGTGLALLLCGVVGAVVAIVGPFVPPEWMDPTLRAGLPQLVVLLVSLALGGVGFLLIRILFLNLRLLIAAIRKALPH